MRTLFLTICIAFLTPLLVVAQDEPQRTTSELHQLLGKSRNDTSRVLLLLELAMNYVLKPGASDSDMNMARLHTGNAIKLSNALRYERGIGKCCWVYSNIFRERDDTVNGKRYIRQAIGIFSKLGIPADLADVYIEAANYIDPYNENEVNEKIRLYEQAILLYHQAGEKFKEANAMKNTGDYYQLSQRFEEALAITKKALQLYQEVHYTKLQAVYDQLGMLNSMLGQHYEAIRYGMLALKTAEKEKDSSAMLSTIYNRLGTTYYYIEQLDTANHYYQAGLSLAIKRNDTASILILATNMATAYVQANRPEAAITLLKQLETTYGRTKRYNIAGIYKCLLMAYVRAKEYKKARPYMEYVLKLTQSYAADDPRRYWAEIYLIEYFAGVGEYRKVISVCRNIETIPSEYYNPRDMVMVYNLWHQADSALGNFKDALAHCKMSIAIGDSLNSVKVKNQISQQLVQYETEKKEKDIQLLTQQSQLQKSLLQQATFSRNATLAGIGVTLLVSGLLYNQYKIKQRRNKQLEQQQKKINESNTRLQHLLTEKEWLLKEIHHRIKNNLQTIMSLLNSQSAYLSDDAALAAIQDSRHRIHAMSLIHQKLYTTDHLSVIDIPVYIHELTGYMRDSFDTAQRICFRVDIAPLKLDVAQAIPLALILNEAITNSLKYAFPDERKGMISISLANQVCSQYLLTIKDDGVGMPPDVQPPKGSLGMSLMKGLSEDLDGTFNITSSEKGTLVSISFVQDTKAAQFGFTGSQPAVINT